MSTEEGRMSEELDRQAALLRATSDGLVLSINEIGVRERMKRGIPPADPSFPELARQVRIAAEVILDLARKEEETAVRTAAAPEVAELPPIETVAPGTNVASILEAWRVVEQRLEAATPGSEESRELVREFERLRQRYADAVEAKIRGSEHE
jgi:hypothetical protein